MFLSVAWKKEWVWWHLTLPICSTSDGKTEAPWPLSVTMVKRRKPCSNPNPFSIIVYFRWSQQNDICCSSRCRYCDVGFSKLWQTSQHRKARTSSLTKLHFKIRTQGHISSQLCILWFSGASAAGYTSRVFPPGRNLCALQRNLQYLHLFFGVILQVVRTQRFSLVGLYASSVLHNTKQKIEIINHFETKMSRRAVPYWNNVFPLCQCTQIRDEY